MFQLLKKDIHSILDLPEHSCMECRRYFASGANMLVYCCMTQAIPPSLLESDAM